ncbi:MAG: hypothetical protein ACFE9Q_02815 [Candidatus Hodarchaeota archaeon]
MAMVIVAMIEKFTKKEVLIEYSDLTPNGRITNIINSMIDNIKK